MQIVCQVALSNISSKDTILAPLKKHVRGSPHERMENRDAKKALLPLYWRGYTRLPPVLKVYEFC